MTQLERDLEGDSVLLAERDRYRELFESAPGACLLTDSSGLIVEANSIAGELLGIPHKRLVGKPIAIFIPVENRKQFRRTLLKLNRNTAAAEWQLELVSRDERRFDAVLNAAPALGGGLRWTIQDISERVAVERHLRTLASALEERVLERTDELERERARLEAVVDQLPVGLVIVEARSGHAATMNEEASSDHGHGRGAVEQLPLERTLVDGEAVFGERLEFHDAEHGSIVVLFSAAPVRERSGLIASAVATLQDITRVERRERAEREFVTNAAHELQTPLAAITSAIEVLEAGAKDSEDRDRFLAHIDREAQRLTGIVRSLLTLARAQTGHEQPRSELLELCPLLEGTAERMEPAEGVEVVIDCPHDLAVLANRDLLEQTISNIVSNAVKYTNEGSIRLVGFRAANDVEITVEDTGSGIAEEELPRVFDRFYRAAESRGGFGLGLAIAHASVETMGGELKISSQPGEGTIVSFTLPTRATLVGP